MHKIKKVLLTLLLCLTTLFALVGFGSCVETKNESDFQITIDKTEAEYGETVTIRVMDESLWAGGLYYYADSDGAARQQVGWGGENGYSVSCVVKKDTIFYVESGTVGHSNRVSVKIKPVNGVKLSIEESNVAYGETITLNAVCVPSGVSYCIDYYVIVDGIETKLQSNRYVMNAPSVTFYAKHETGKESERITVTEKKNEIRTAEEFEAISGSASYVLKNNIDFAGKTLTSIENLSGVLDGGSFTISNFKISENVDNLGLFSTVSGTVKNLHIENVMVEMRGNKSNVGTIAGKNLGLIENCIVKGTITAKYAMNVGGIAGYNDASGIIKNSKSYADVESNDYTGGVCGVSKGTLENCENYGEITGKSYVGGVCGFISEGMGKNLRNQANITADGTRVGGVIGEVSGAVSAVTVLTSDGDVETKDEWVGGLIGRVYTANISEFSHSGSVKGLGTVGSYFGALEVATSLVGYENVDAVSGTTYVGGIVGWAKEGTIITGCVNRGTITASIYQGGIVGGGAATLIDCENRGTITNVNGKPIGNLLSSYVGGIAGECKGIEECRNTTPITGVGAYTGGYAGYATGEIKNCENSVAVTGTKFVGGIVGCTNASVLLSKNTASVTGTEYVGGGIGYGNSVNDFVNSGAISGTTYIGGVIGGQNGGTAELCENNGEILGNECIGGIIGEATNDVKIITNTNYGKTTGKEKTGGVVGKVHWGMLTGNENYGEIIGESNTGGVIGYAFFITLTYCENEGAVLGETRVGGIIGYAEGILRRIGNWNLYNHLEGITIYGCINKGTINAQTHVGGVIGLLQMKADNPYSRETFTVEVKQCSNEGKVTASDNNAGGICGVAYGVAGQIGSSNAYAYVYIQFDNCINTASIKANENAGGIIGYKANSYVNEPTNCTDTSNS